jgi:hypothetical protein
MKAWTAGCGAGFVVAAAGSIAGIASHLWFNTPFSAVLGAFLVAPIAAAAGLLSARKVRQRPVPWPAAMALLLAGLLLAGLGLHAPQSRYLPQQYVDTCFAPGFDRERFSEVQTGMSRADVEAILGRPKYLRDPSWGYRIDGSPDLIWAYSTDHCSPSGDYAWRSYEVGFRNGAVVSASDAWRHD